MGIGFGLFQMKRP